MVVKMVVKTGRADLLAFPLVFQQLVLLNVAKL
jgi:hypothetical protein